MPTNTSNIIFTVIRRNSFLVEGDYRLKPTANSPKVGTRFYNIGDDVAYINKVPLLPGQEYLYEGNTDLSLDETVYDIDFEDLLPNRKVVVIESVIAGYKKKTVKI